jgi:Luciferase-like monooxygenase
VIEPLNTYTPARRGLGITAGLDPRLARDLAVRCEQLGYHSLWSNDEPTAPGLATLAHFAAAATQVGLGVGALPGVPEQVGDQLEPYAALGEHRGAAVAQLIGAHDRQSIVGTDAGELGAGVDPGSTACR